MLKPGRSGLSKPSTAVVDQMHSIDKQRIHRRYGRVSAVEPAAIDNGLLIYLGLDPDRWGPEAGRTMASLVAR